MEQLNFNFGLGGALPKGYTLSSYTFGQAINTIDIESVNIPENVKVILNTFISNDKIMNVPLSNNKALMSYFRIIKKFNVKPKADFLDFLVTREYISEFPDNNPTKESEVAVGILDSYIENTSGQVIIENNSGQVMANGGGLNDLLEQGIINKIKYYPNGIPPKNHKYGVKYKGKTYTSNDTDDLVQKVLLETNKMAKGGGVGIVKKDRYFNVVTIGDAIHIRVLIGRYGQTKDYEGIVTNFDQFGNVELDGQKSVSYTADYEYNDYEHGHHIWVEKINAKDIKENLRVPKKFVPFFSSQDKVYGEDVKFRGTEIELKEFLKNKYPNSVWGQWNPLYNKGWRYNDGKYISPDGQEYDKFDFYESVEQGQGYLNMLMIPKKYANDKAVGNKKLENIKNRLFAKHKK